MENEIQNIKRLPPQDRPRERLLREGPTALSNIDLIAILIGSGTQAIPLMHICAALISIVNNGVSRLSGLSLQQLRRVKGIGEFKAMTLIAAFELGRRSTKPGAPSLLKDEAVIKSFISDYFWNEAIIQYNLLLMNHRQELLATHEIAVEDRQLPALKPIIKLCLEAGAASIIICRNEIERSEQYLNKEKAFVVHLDAASAMLKIKMRGLLIV